MFGLTNRRYKINRILKLVDLTISEKMNQRNSYHTTIKLAYALDIQKQWLPSAFTKAIPRSTSHGWKSEKSEMYVGLEYATIIGDNVDELKLICDDKLRREKQLFIAYTRLKLTLIEVY